MIAFMNGIRLRGIEMEEEKRVCGRSDIVEFARDVLGIELLPHQEEMLRGSRGELRIRILRGSSREAMAAFGELMRRNMEEI